MRSRKLIRTDGLVDVLENFCVLFEELDSTCILGDAITQNLCVFLVGHFQSEKTSVLYYLSNTKTNYFYVHSSKLLDGFLSSKKNKNLECMIDEIRELTKLISNKSIGIKSIIYTGTYSIVAMLKDGISQIRKFIWKESKSESLSHASKLLEPEPISSPLNFAKIIQASDFTREQHMLFFKDIQEDRDIRINEDVLNDIYNITNSYSSLKKLLVSLYIEYSVNEKFLEFDK
ncbi:11528_t:CDS:2 [Funneliformis mosseae]|uniref:11528_t:CDS:1 n=1 Tax=Funneliformis mosseae TaxID=27381 RepID=A0A9N9EPQ8_FUNMO|nr:11528_t:CDS:2 [Funneliformis mosseae]